MNNDTFDYSTSMDNGTMNSRKKKKVSESFEGQIVLLLFVWCGIFSPSRWTLKRADFNFLVIHPHCLPLLYPISFCLLMHPPIKRQWKWETRSSRVRVRRSGRSKRTFGVNKVSDHECISRLWLLMCFLCNVHPRSISDKSGWETWEAHFPPFL